MKKILFIIPTLTQTNGVAAFMVNYIKNFSLNEFEIEVLYYDLRPSKAYLDFFESRKIKTYKLPYIRDFGLKRYYKEIKDFFKLHHDFDLIYSNIGYQTYFFYSISKKYGLTNYAIHAHATQFSDNKIKNFLGKIIQKKVNKFALHKYACSKLAGETLFKNYNYKIINNAIDYDKYIFNQNYRTEIRDEFKIKSNNILLGFIGRFAPQKNVFFFVELAKELTNNYKIMMIGNGPQKKEFVNTIKDNSLENKFILIDETQYVYKYYSAFDYFLLPSLYEGLPVVGVEAQANGLPCLLSNTISTECQISNNIEYIDKDAISKWIVKIKKMKRGEKLLLNDYYNIKVQSKLFEQELIKILNKKEV